MRQQIQMRKLIKNSTVYLSGLQLRLCTQKITFLFLNRNICCMLWVLKRNVSFEHHKHMLKLNVMKIFTIARSKIWFILTNVYVEKVKLIVYPRAYIMMKQVRKPFIVGTNYQLSAYNEHWHSSFVFYFILWKQSLYKSCSSNLIICNSFNGQIIHV